MSATDSRHVALPRPMALVRRVTLHLAEAVLIPLGLFYTVDELVGLWPALAASLGWVAAAVVVHLARRGRPTTLLAAMGALASVQIGLTAWADSAVLFYLQPTLAAYGFAVALLVTSWWRMPLIERLAADFVQLPASFLEHPVVRRFFRRLSYLWSGVLGLNATVTLLCLLRLSTTLAVPLAAAASVPVFLAGVVVSYVLFRQTVRDGGFLLCWGAC